MKYKKEIFSLIGILLVITAIFSFFLRAYTKTASGKGFSSYFTGTGLKYNYWGATVLGIVLLAGIIYSTIYFLKSKREEKDLIKKYGKKNDRNT